MLLMPLTSRHIAPSLAMSLLGQWCHHIQVEIASYHCYQFNRARICGCCDCC
jgi:hypothetical protein